MASLELQCLSRGVWPGWSLKIRSNDRSLLTFRDSFEPEEVEAVDVDGLDPDNWSELLFGPVPWPLSRALARALS